jgi:hypothetical protein
MRVEPAQGPPAVAEPHTITLAVWAIPEAVAAGERFTIKVGARSSAGTSLAGGRIELRDASGAVIACSCLGAAVWPGTSALFWADVELRAPAAPGRHALSAHFDSGEMDPPHGDASFRFDVTVVEPPEHTVTVKVAEKGTAAPVADAQLRLGPHRALTDESGRAAMRSAKGRLDLRVWKAGYEAPMVAIDIDHDTVVHVEVTPIPEADPDARWTG